MLGGFASLIVFTLIQATDAQATAAAWTGPTGAVVPFASGAGSPIALPSTGAQVVIGGLPFRLDDWLDNPAALSSTAFRSPPSVIDARLSSAAIASAAPEPGVMSLVFGGLGLLLWMSRRRLRTPSVDEEKAEAKES